MDIWTFYEIVANINMFRAEDQDEKDASDFREISSYFF